MTLTVASATAAVPVPAMVRAEPPDGVAVTVNRLPAGADSASSGSSKVTVSAVPFTDALSNCGAVVSVSFATVTLKSATAWPAASCSFPEAGAA